MAVCGAGAAGTELAFAFKKRWSQVFGQEIQVTLISAHETVMGGAEPSVIDLVTKKLAEHRIDIEYSKHVSVIDENGVQFREGGQVECTVPVWATGAES